MDQKVKWGSACTPHDDAPQINVCEETTVVFPLYMEMHKLTFSLFKNKYVVKLQETSLKLSAQT